MPFLAKTAIVVLFLAHVTAHCSEANANDEQEGQQTPSTVLVSAELRDGSRINGRLLEPVPFSLRTSLAYLEISPQLVQEVRRNHGQDTVVVEFQNGDRLTGSLDNRRFKLKTMLGEFDIAFRNVMELQLRPTVSLPAELREKLVVHYSFDLSSRQAFDLSGNNNHGVVLGANVTENGKYGNGLQFAGDAYVEIGKSMSLQLREVTVSAWIRFDNDDADNKFWIAKCPVDSQERDYGFQVFGADGQVWTYVNDGENWIGNFSRQSTGDGWLHVIATYDGEGNATHYINGANIRHNESEGSLGEIPDRHTWKLGAWEKQRFTGTADEVMIFNRALQADEVEKLFDSVN